ncbi:MAG: DNA repair protein RecN [Verrucomicrobiaceae bacterium]|nr:DNA repair protein RecN [Verrucomicrobiaceae bacterium]
MQVVKVAVVMYKDWFRIMLEFVKISNLALMNSETVEFSKGFTVLTGETGAGKSVLLGALAILAGNRVGKEVVGNYGEQCVVQAQLLFEDCRCVNLFLEENSLPVCEENSLVISRSISKSKSGRVMINGALTTLATLSKLGQLWIDFHGANEPQKLFSEKNQLNMLDAFAHNDVERDEYLQKYRQYAEMLKEIDALKNSKKLSPDEIEFLRKRIAEIENLNPSKESIAELEEQAKLAEMSSEIVETASEISATLLSEEGVSSMLASANRLASGLANVSDNAKSLYERVASASIEIADIAQEYERMARGCNMSAGQIEQIRRQMSTWLSLGRKYGASVDDVLLARDEMKHRIEMQSDIKASLDKLAFESEKMLLALQPLAEKVYKTRKKASEKLAKSVCALLEKLGFKRPRFEIELAQSKEPCVDCQSSCSFRFSANAGYEPLELAKIASSGELARVMLSIKTVLAEQDSTPVLVFDEVDANVGGEIGSEVGAQLAKLAKKHQVFCVTHLPQVASQGDNHLVVVKTQTDTSTSVSISSLTENDDARVSEIARMLGDRNADTAIEMAKKLLQK